MPTAPVANCSQSGCPNKAVSFGRCTQHGYKRDQTDYDRKRGNSSSRGYGSTWRRLRLAVLSRDVVCVACNRAMATEADHIVPKRDGGPDSMENLQGLCKSCHSRKTIGGG